MHDPSGMEKRQFRVLYREFLLRVIDLELLSADADTARLLGQFAALFAGMSWLFTFWLIFAGSGLSKIFLLVMEHFLIATTMIVVALLSVFCWDSIFPDRRDVLVLAPLPIRARTLFRAKMAAVLSALCLSVVSLNIFSGLIWPRMFSITNGGGLSGMSRSMAAYWITMVLAGAFMFCCVIGVQGIASQLLPRQQFLRLSALLQVAAFFLFLGIYILEPSLETPKALAAPENQRLLAWLPSYWFFGLFQQLNGSMLPVFAPLVRRAWIGLGVSGSVAVFVTLRAYLRTMGKIVEQPDILPGTHRSNWSPRFGALLQTSIVLFGLRTLLRSKQHRVLLAFYLGTGFAAMLAYIRTPLRRLEIFHRAADGAADVSFLVASLWMICFAVLIVRLVISMPHTLRANWIFRMTELREASIYVSAVRRLLLVLAVAPVWLFLAVLFLSHWPTWTMAGHLVVLALVGMILVELSLNGFQKLPFTCSYLPGQSKVHVVFWGILLVLIPLIGARFEDGILNHPLNFVCMIVVLGAIAACARWRTNSEAKLAEQLIFEEEYPPEIFGLNLPRNAGVPLTSSQAADQLQKML